MGNTDAMTELDHMVMFCLLINLIKLILDYMLTAIDDSRRRHTALPYGMLLICIFARAQLPINDHRKDEKCPTTTNKTFSTMGLKFQDPDIEGEKQKRRRKRKRKKKEER